MMQCPLERAPVGSGTSRSVVLAAAEPERMFTVLLADLKVAFPGYKDDLPVGVEAHRAYVMYGLPVRLISPQPEHHVVPASLKKLVSSLLILKVILLFQLPAKRLDCFAKLDVHHVCSSQLARQRVEKLLRFAVVRLLVRSEQFLDSVYRRNSLSCGTYRARGKTKSSRDRSNIHLISSPIARPQCNLSMSRLRLIEPFQCLFARIETGFRRWLVNLSAIRSDDNRSDVIELVNPAIGIGDRLPLDISITALCKFHAAPQNELSSNLIRHRMRPPARPGGIHQLPSSLWDRRG